MKILLVRPVVDNFKKLNAVPPLGLGYLSSSLRSAGFDNMIVDCLAKGYTFDDFAKIIRGELPDIVGFQVYSQDVRAVNQSIDIAKKIKPQILTIVGGPHPSGVGKEVYSHIPKADFAFQGEAELSLPQLIKVVEQGKNADLVDSGRIEPIPGLIWRREGRIYANPPVFVDKLDLLEFPDWEQINPSGYPHAPQGIIFKSLPVAPIIATRGCPFPCTFCAGHTVSGSKIRKRSIENIISEIKVLAGNYNVKEVHILDDNFSFDKDYIKNFCLALLDSGIKISWCCPNGLRLDTLTEEIVRLMKKSGCYYISVGIESGSNLVLSAMRKQLNIEQIIKQIRMIKGASMDVNGFFIVGYPGESEKDIFRTIDFAKSLPLTRAAFYNFLPLPGTQIYKELSERNELERIEWDNIFQGDVPYTTAGISKPRLKQLQRRAYREFYLRPRVFFNLLSKIKTLNQLLYILKRARVYI